MMFILHSSQKRIKLCLVLNVLIYIPLKIAFSFGTRKRDFEGEKNSIFDLKRFSNKNDANEIVLFDAIFVYRGLLFNLFDQSMNYFFFFEEFHFQELYLI